MDNVVNDLTVHQTLANGNAILIFYDIFVLCLFLFEVFLYINREHYKALLRKNMEAGTTDPSSAPLSVKINPLL